MKWLLVGLIFLSGSSTLYAQANGDYQTRQTGDWSGTTTWQIRSGGAWVNTATPPTSTNGVITILATHIVTVTAGVTVDQVAINGTLTINSGITLTAGSNATFISGGTGTLTVNGTINNAAGNTFTAPTTASFNSGSTYTHHSSNSSTGGVIPTATWDSNSTLRIAFSSAAAYSLSGSSWSQSFGHVVIAITASGNRTHAFNGLLTTIKGNLTINQLATNNGILNLASSGTNSVSVDGNFTMNLTAGTTISLNLASAAGVTTTLNIKGNFSHTSGSITTTGTGNINFNGSGATQTFTRGTGTLTTPVNFSIASGAVVSMGTTPFWSAASTGNFTLIGELQTGNATGLNGTINNTSGAGGSRTFNANSTITYNGGVAQVMGGFYPGSPASGLNVVINNSTGVTTSSPTSPATTITSIPGTLTLQNGNLIVAAGHTLQIDGSMARTSGNISMDAAANLTINGSGALGVSPFPFPSSQTFTNFTLNRSSSTVTLGNSVTINGVNTLTNGTLALAAQQLTLNGNVSISSGLISGTSSSTLTISGTGTLSTVNFESGGNTLGTLNLSRSGGSLTFGGDFTITSALNITTGTLNAGSSTITMQGSLWSVDGGSGGVFSGGTGLVIFDGATSLPFSSSFNNIQLNTSRSLSFPADNVNVSGNLNFASGATFIPSTGTVILNGNADQSFSSNGLEFYTVQVNKALGAMNITSSLPIQHLLDIQSVTAVNTNGNLTLLSRGATTDQDGAIGAVATGASVNGNVTVQRFMDPVGNTYRYLGSSVSGALPPVSWGTKIYRYNGITKAYVTHSTSSALTVGTGYVLGKNMISNETWSVSGPVITGSFTWNFTAEGWYLLGNPFASAIRWFDSPGVAWDLTNISTTIAVTDNAVAGYPNYFRYWSYNPADNPTNWGTGELTNGMVAMGQAFWIYAGAGGGSLTIHEQAKENSLSGEFYRTRSSGELSSLKVTLDNGVIGDMAYLRIDPQAKYEYEFNSDLKKLYNPEMNVYLAGEEGNALVFNTMDKMEIGKNIPIGMDVPSEGEYTLSFEGEGTFPYADQLYLHDVYAGKSVPVSEKYTFTVNESIASHKNRFYLSLNALTPERKLTEVIEAYPNPVLDKLTIRTPSREKVSIRLVNNQGKVCLSQQVNEVLEIDMRGYAQGVYLLQFFSNGEVVTRKIVR